MRRQVRGSTMLSEQAWAEIARSLTLSPRELQIVRGIFDDCTEATIGAKLAISPHTVHSYIDRIHHKLAVMDRSQLILRIVGEFLTLTGTVDGTLPPICTYRAASVCPLHG